jgi:phenylacetate-CoA ligase
MDDKIVKIVNHAYKNVPFYKEYYDSHEVDIRDINTSGDLEILPTISKSLIRKYFPDKMMARGLEGRAIYDKTSGSSGVPFEFYDDMKCTTLKLSSYMFFNTWMGVGTNARHAHIASPKKPTFKSNLKKFIFNKNSVSSLKIKPANVEWVVKRLENINPVYLEGYSASPKKPTFKSNLKKFIFNKNSVSSLKIKPANVEWVVKRLENINPVYLEGYSASLYNTARLIKDVGYEVKISPKAVVATSEDLIEPHRKVISEVFRAPVFNRYGSREFSGAVAQECDLYEGLHVNTMLSYLEILDYEDDPVNKGERGRIVLTDLNNMVMPFIRYDIGDTAIKGEESGECGRNLPIIRDVVGKSEFFLISKNGERTPMETIQSYIFQHYVREVHRFQFIHDKLGHFYLRIVPSEKFNEGIIAGIRSYLDNTISDMDYDIELVEDIPPSKSGKTPFFIIQFEH